MSIAGHLSGGGLGGACRFDESGEFVHLSHHPNREGTRPERPLCHLSMVHCLYYFKIQFGCLPGGFIRRLTEGGLAGGGAVLRAYGRPQ